MAIPGLTKITVNTDTGRVTPNRIIAAIATDIVAVTEMDTEATVMEIRDISAMTTTMVITGIETTDSRATGIITVDMVTGRIEGMVTESTIMVIMVIETIVGTEARDMATMDIDITATATMVMGTIEDRVMEDSQLAGAATATRKKVTK